MGSSSSVVVAFMANINDFVSSWRKRVGEPVLLLGVVEVPTGILSFR